MRSNSEISFAIIKHIGIIKGPNNNGWSKEVNLVSWNGAEPKYDIREWDENHEKMSKGITLTEEEASKLAWLLNGGRNE